MSSSSSSSSNIKEHVDAGLLSVKASVASLLSKSPIVDKWAIYLADQSTIVVRKHGPQMVLNYLPPQGIEMEYVAAFLMIFALLLLITLGFSRFLIDLVGLLYPAYASIRAIETLDTKDDTQWLTYWLIFCVLKVFETICAFLLPLIPFYLYIKVNTHTHKH